MKKSLAKKITLSILAGAMLMTSSVAWAEGLAEVTLGDAADADGFYAIAIGNGADGKGADATGAYSIAIGTNSVVNSGYDDTYSGSIAIGKDSKALGTDNIAIGTGAKVGVGNNEGNRSVALGNQAQSTGHYSVALGYGSIAYGGNEVSVGYGGPSGEYTYLKEENGVLVKVDSDEKPDVWYPNTRSIINVTDVPDWENTNGYGSYAVNVNTLNNALAGYVKKEAMNDGSSTTNVTDTFNVVETIVDTNTKTTTVTINATDEDKIVMDKDGITVGQNSARIDGSGFYVWDGGDHTAENAKASMTKDGKIKAANGAFIVNESGNVTAQDVTANNFIIKGANSSDINIGTKLGELDSKVQTNTTTIATKADQSALDAEKTAREQADQDLQSQIDNIGGGAIAGINQRLDKTNAKINKVGAGAAALAALHPLEYDPDDKLTFSAGMGNYAGENAAALGAFYRPNEKFMVSLGGTMGNGENMVNLGLSIGLDKPNGFAKMSKRELIQEVNAVKAENNMLVQKVDAVEAELAEMKALLQAIMAKK